MKTYLSVMKDALAFRSSSIYPIVGLHTPQAEVYSAIPLIVSCEQRGTCFFTGKWQRDSNLHVRLCQTSWKPWASLPLIKRKTTPLSLSSIQKDLVIQGFLLMLFYCYDNTLKRGISASLFCCFQDILMSWLRN